MPKFVTIGYGDRAGYNRLTAALREVAHAHDEKLRRDGALMGIAGPPVQLRNPDATGLETTDGAFMSSSLPVAGFAVIEAADMAQAVRLLSLTPCAVAHGVVEIWPLQEP
ncbi:transcription initiation protein [Ancylobacter sp. Lp-2]|uniref:transcription initiation protein n=1 Tax=Ancylobacter sp. Lp-2 TaxID=2881339 RepID=UPI001E55523B|nr:transcription initiation protein [Ancylobacter sp. Lp-2]MCB4771009.1 transcription initiation protein [Ancylobacter sp. Lp-2]